MMHRYTIFLLLILSLVLGGVRAWAQGTPLPPTGEPIIITNPPPQLITGAHEWQPITLTPIDEPASISAPTADPASDSCSLAPELNVANGDAGVTTVNDFTTEGSDPLLSCAWGGSKQGERTAWYQFTAPFNGQVVLKTVDGGKRYDTLLAVHAGECDTLTPVACNDDNNGFLSQIQLMVRKGETYYVEIADWDDNAPTEERLSIQALMVPVQTQWSQETSIPIGGLSRHATAVTGSDIYVIGGQSSLASPPTITNFFQRYETDTDKWVDPTQSEGPYYSNTTAVYLNGYIYVPSGYAGGSSYDMTHWAYNVQGGSWVDNLAPIPSTPFAWATAVAAPTGNGYYVIGGLNTVDPPTAAADVRRDVYFYLIAGDGVWLPSTLMNDARYAHTAALVNNKICVVGGLKHDGVNLVLLPDGECFTLGSGWVTNIPPLNYPRYAADSAVGPDGKWYVFGGVNASGEAVSETEVYDPANPSAWTILNVNYDLGGTTAAAARAWPRGGVVDSYYYAFGGNNMPDQQPLPLLEKIFLPAQNTLLPAIFSNYGDNNRPDDHFGVARPIIFNVPQFRNFDTSDDRFDIYYFDLSATSTITARLTQVPNDSDYNLYIYDLDKDRKGKSENLLGANEAITLNNLLPGRYYVVVERIWPSGIPNKANYRIIVEK